MNDNTTALLSELAAAEWFRNVGKHDSDDVEFVASWEDALKSVRGSVWTGLGGEWANVLRRNVQRVGWDHYNRWNDLVIALKLSVLELCGAKTRSLRASRSMPKVFLDDVHWHILGACMETEYSDIVPAGQSYTLARWYIAGHLPCGWRGEWPEGKLIVY
jgi:hypothetical protein